MGKQMQVDFGMIKVPKSTQGEIKLYVMCFVLSHSRENTVSGRTGHLILTILSEYMKMRFILWRHDRRSCV